MCNCKHAPCEHSNWPQRFAVFAFEQAKYEDLDEHDRGVSVAAAEWAYRRIRSHEKQIARLRTRLENLRLAIVKCDACGCVTKPCETCEGTGNGLVHGVEDWCGACDGTGRSAP